MADPIEIIVTGEPTVVEIINSEETKVIEVGTPAASPVIFTALTDYQDPYLYIGNLYIGKAPMGTAQDAANWQITRVEISEAGQVTELHATNVKWTERLTVIYS